jgi:hypothetical protein
VYRSVIRDLFLRRNQADLLVQRPEADTETRNFACPASREQFDGFALRLWLETAASN